MLKYFTRAALAALLVASSVPAMALTAPPSFGPRQNTTQQVNYFRKTVNFNDANVATGYQFGTLPLNAYILTAACQITTAFNAGTTNVLSMGVTLTSANELLTTSTTTVAFYNGTAANLGNIETATASTVPGALGAVPLTVKYTQTGTAATTGQAICTVTYIPNNDQ